MPENKGEREGERERERDSAREREDREREREKWKRAAPENSGSFFEFFWNDSSNFQQAWSKSKPTATGAGESIIVIKWVRF